MCNKARICTNEKTIYGSEEIYMIHVVGSLPSPSDAEKNSIVFVTKTLTVTFHVWYSDRYLLLV